LQGHFVQLTRQYQKNLAEINLTKERNDVYNSPIYYNDSECNFVFLEIQIMEYKVMRLENAINTHKVEENKMNKTLHTLQTRIDQLSKQMSDDKDHNLDLENKYNDLTLKYAAKMKVCYMVLMKTVNMRMNVLL